MALAVPVIVKYTKTGGNGRLDYAVSAMQGYRVNMEDDHAAVENLDAATATSFFGVYDGHGGPAVAKYCAKHLHIELLKHQGFRNNLNNAIEETFLRMDIMLRDRRAAEELYEYRGDNQWKEYRKKLRLNRFIPCFVKKPPYEGPVGDGCTACVAVIRGNQVTVGNAGDSRCVLSRNGQAINLSTDHKPYVPAETQRIINAGHEVISNPDRGGIPRVDDGIAISRSIGDLMYKDNQNLSPQEQALTAFPEVRSEEITDDTEFLVIACDGIWDCMSSQEVVTYVREHLETNFTLSEICESLIMECVVKPQGNDNMTVLVVRFKKPPSAAIGSVASGPPSLPPPILQSALVSTEPPQSIPEPAEGTASSSGQTPDLGSQGGSELKRTKSAEV